MQLNYTTSYWASAFGYSDIATLALVNMGGTTRLVFSPRHANDQSSIVIASSTSASPQGNIVYAVQSAPNYAWQDANGAARMFNLSAFNAPMKMNTFLANGTPNATQYVIPPEGGHINDATAAQVLEFAAGDWIAIARRSDDGLTLHQLSGTGTLTAQVQIEDTDKTYVQTISDTATLARGNDQLLLTISALENGISSFLISANGTSTWIDSYGAQNGMAVSGLAMLKTVQIGGVDFAILAATNSSSLTVLRVNEMGVFFETDHVFDTGATRFAKLAAFDMFVAQGRVFVVAAGTDIGMTLLELLPDGTLSTMQTFVLEGGTGLTAVTAITAQMLGEDAAIFMVDSGADRILRYDLDLGALGGIIHAAGGAGTAADERVIGSAGNDAVNGAGGADFLHDGAGLDTMTGGAGADVFIFTRDGAQDYITDFQDGVDRIDVSAWGRIYTAQSLVITATATGANVTYGNEVLTITSHNGAPLGSAQLTDADFIF
ncbi:MAG: hypothetical protein U5N55_13830 [Cypionkella sp.]|nr:hypothetical protein [Cypionkella sp.]